MTISWMSYKSGMLEVEEESLTWSMEEEDQNQMKARKCSKAHDEQGERVEKDTEAGDRGGEGKEEGI